MRAFDLATRQPWLITEDGLRTILQIAERSLADVDLAALVRAERESRPSAVAAQAGRPLDGARSVKVRDGVALIDITGPIIRRADFFSEMSGATSVGTLALDFQQALTSPGVEAILLVVDSPGGEVTGISEFAAQIVAARSEKPVWAYVEGLGASAAYWLSSAAERVLAADTALLGSIGVVMAVRDPSKVAARDIEFVSSQSPKKRPDPLSEAGRAQLQQVVDDLATVFVRAVADQRGVSEQTVLDNFGQGGVFVGAEAVTQGLADEVSTFEATLAALAEHARERRMSPRDKRHMAAPMEDLMAADKGFWTQFFGGLFSASAEAGGPVTVAAAAEASEGATGAAPAQSATPAAQPAQPAAAQPDPEAERMRAQLEAQQRDLAAAREQLAALENQQRTARLGALAQGWYGAHEDHVTVLVVLADAVGEDGAAFTAYTRLQTAAAEAVKSGKLFAELGSGKPAATGTVTERMLATVKARQAATPGLSFSDAVAVVAGEDPALYQDYMAENTQKI